MFHRIYLLVTITNTSLDLDAPTLQLLFPLRFLPLSLSLSVVQIHNEISKKHGCVK